MTTLIKTIAEIKDVLKNSKRDLGFVPTMGALHDGHISLIKASKEECQTSIVSVFINPTQFSPNEDFENYPRSLENDLEVCKRYNVDYVFAPEISEIYPTEKDKELAITPPTNLTMLLCGLTRRNHFQGVANVVKKLFDIVNPDYAYFGEKDLQQLYIIRWLVKEYKIPTFIRACPIIREKNGLAFSSRNAYLNPNEKEIASNLYKSLQIAKRNVKSGIFSPPKAILESLIFLSQYPELKVEYFDARCKENLEKVSENKLDGFYFLVAGKINNIRLIDNIEV